MGIGLWYNNELFVLVSWIFDFFEMVWWWDTDGDYGRFEGRRQGLFLTPHPPPRPFPGSCLGSD